mgnify:CR=1 FL=1
MISDLTVAFGGVMAIDALSAELDAPGVRPDRPNGAGKTTLVNLLSGLGAAAAPASHVWTHADLLGLKPIERVRFGLRRSFQTEQVVEAPERAGQRAWRCSTTCRMAARCGCAGGAALSHTPACSTGDRCWAVHLNLFQAPHGRSRESRWSASRG